MKNKIKQFAFLFIAFLFSAFIVGDSKSEYILPAYGRTIVSFDSNEDNNIDIFTGHYEFWQTEWGGGVLLTNENGTFIKTDSMFFNDGFQNVHTAYIDDNELVDVYSTTITNDPYQIFITIIHNYGETQFDSIHSFYIYNEGPLPGITSGDINGDGFVDIAFYHNINQLWGVIYNDGTGNFSAPEYFDLDFPPVDINCADLDGDGKSEVALCGMHTEIYSWTESGFEQLVLTTTTSAQVLMSDFDKDGDLDIITATTLIYPNNRVFFFENIGNKEFVERPNFDFSPFCSHAEIADFNNDSLPDIVFNAHDHSGLHIYKNKGDFQLEFDQYIPIENTSTSGTNCNDFDNNGFQDIAILKDGLPSTTLQMLFNDGEGSFINTPVKTKQDIAINYSLNFFPNPFTDIINIQYTLQEKSFVNISVYNFNGELIKVLTNKNQKGGNHLTKWDGLEQRGKQCKPAPYLLTFEVNGIICKTTKIIKY